MFFNFKSEKNMKKKHAFTMIEILMIAIVMWTALLGVLAIMKKMEQANIKIARNVIATNLAVQGYELTRAQADDIRYDYLLSKLWVTGANNRIESGNEVQRLQEWIYYIVYTEQKTWLTYSWDIITGWLSNTDWDKYKQLRVILWAVCSGTKLSQTWICLNENNTWELVYNSWSLWSWICLQDNWWLPCTWWWQFFREVVISEDIKNKRYWYNVCSKVIYNWQAWWQAKKEQIAEICAKIN